MKLQRGTVVLVSLDRTRGHEQRGTRPCVVVSDSDVTEDQRFPLLAVVPISSTASETFLLRGQAAKGQELQKNGAALSSRHLIMRIRRRGGPCGRPPSFSAYLRS